jgi:HigB_toxin, RelE-like toxic component of a toxin-antitoxin system
LQAFLVYTEARRARWERPADVKANRRNVSILANNRVVFNIKGNDYRLVVAMRYDKQIMFIRFIGTPGGQLKFLRLWPGQIPPGATTGGYGLLLGTVALYKTVGSLFETVAFASKLDEHASVHEAVEDGGGLCGVTEVLLPVGDDPV